MKKLLLTTGLVAAFASSTHAQVIGTGNNFDSSRDEVSIVRDGTAEGYATAQTVADGLAQIITSGTLDMATLDTGTITAAIADAIVNSSSTGGAGNTTDELNTSVLAALAGTVITVSVVDAGGTQSATVDIASALPTLLDNDPANETNTGASGALSGANVLTVNVVDAGGTQSAVVDLSALANNDTNELNTALTASIAGSVITIGVTDSGGTQTDTVDISSAIPVAADPSATNELNSAVGTALAGTTLTVSVTDPGGVQSSNVDLATIIPADPDTSVTNEVNTALATTLSGANVLTVSVTDSAGVVSNTVDLSGLANVAEVDGSVTNEVNTGAAAALSGANVLTVDVTDSAGTQTATVDLSSLANVAEVDGSVTNEVNTSVAAALSGANVLTIDVVDPNGTQTGTVDLSSLANVAEVDGSITNEVNTAMTMTLTGSTLGTSVTDANSTQSASVNMSGFQNSGMTGALVGTDLTITVTDGFGTQTTGAIDVSSLGSTLTFDSGLTLTGTSVDLGGTLDAATTITTGAAETLTVAGLGQTQIGSDDGGTSSNFVRMVPGGRVFMQATDGTSSGELSVFPTGGITLDSDATVTLDSATGIYRMLALPTTAAADADLRMMVLDTTTNNVERTNDWGSPYKQSDELTRAGRNYVGVLDYVNSARFGFPTSTASGVSLINSGRVGIQKTGTAANYLDGDVSGVLQWALDGTHQLQLGPDAVGTANIGNSGAPDGVILGDDFLQIAGNRGAAGELVELTRTNGDGVVIVFSQGPGDGATAGTEIGDISITAGAVAYNTTSDRDLKNNVQAIGAQEAADRLNTLVPATYAYNIGGGEHIGYIAQNVQVAYPNAVSGVSVAEGGTGLRLAMGFADADQTVLIMNLLSRVAELEAALAAE